MNFHHIHLLSPYALFGFGATGTILHRFTGPAVTASIAGLTGLASGAFIGAAFRYIRRSGAGTALGGRSLAGQSVVVVRMTDGIADVAPLTRALPT